jgi:acetoin utilization deacetylase AcuC-like enzyme
LQIAIRLLLNRFLGFWFAMQSAPTSNELLRTPKFLVAMAPPIDGQPEDKSVECCMQRRDVSAVHKSQSGALLAPNALTSAAMQGYEWDVNHWESSIRLKIVDDILALVPPEGSLHRLEKPVPSFGDLAEEADLLRAHSVDVVQVVVGLAMQDSEESLGLSEGSKQLAIDSFFKAASSSGLLDAEKRALFFQSICRASLTAVSTVLQLANEIMSGRAKTNIALAPVRPAGHHSQISKLGLMCGLNSVMVAALKYASEGMNVGVFDIDVHCGGGTHDIAMRWNKNFRAVPKLGRVFVADVYAYMFDDAVMQQRADEQKLSAQDGHAFDDDSFSSFHDVLRVRPYGSLVERFSMQKNKKKKAQPEAGWEIPADSAVGAGFGDLLFFEHNPEDLTDAAIVQHTQSVITYFQQNDVKVIFMALGLDAAMGDIQPGEITPEGYRKVAKLLRNSGLPVVFALEGGYNTKADVGGKEVENDIDSVFGTSIRGVVQGLTETPE